MTTLRRTIQTISFLFVPLFASPLIAQSQPAPATTLHVNVRVVTMAVTVRDKHGAIVPNLTKDDLTLAEDGRPQTIQYFTHDTNLPLTLGLLVDTSMSQHNVLDAERTASQHFLDQMLTDARDKAFLIQFDREVDLLADVSPDKSKLRAAIDQLGAPQFSNTSDSQDTSSGSHRIGGGGTMLYDAIYLASDELMKKQPDRKALVILTDGVDRGSKETLFSAVEAAQRADTIVYAIYFKGQEPSSNNNGYPRPSSRRNGRQLSRRWLSRRRGWLARGWGRRQSRRRASNGGFPHRRQEGFGAGLRGNRRTHVRSKQEGKPSTIRFIPPSPTSFADSTCSVTRRTSKAPTPDIAQDHPGREEEKDLFVQTRQGYYAGRITCPVQRRRASSGIMTLCAACWPFRCFCFSDCRLRCALFSGPAQPRATCLCAVAETANIIAP